jgi:preprotein translocase subunit YajC
MNNVWIIAQEGGGQTPQTITSEPMNSGEQTNTTVPSDANDGTQRTATPNNPFSLWFIGAIMIIMIFMLFRTPQKQRQQRKKLEQSLEKNDRVLTIGGIIGTIVDIKDDEITLKVDESNNTKIKVKRSAIGRNMSKD